MSNFARLARQYRYDTWDTVVECDDTITEDERSAICRLGYYGKDIHIEHAKMLENGERFVSLMPYTVQLNAVDGKSSNGYDSLEEAKAYITPRLEMTFSDTSFGTDYCRYTLDGFKLSDLGINWKDHQP